MRGKNYTSKQIIEIGEENFAKIDSKGIIYNKNNRFLKYIKQFRKLLETNGTLLYDKDEKEYLIEGFRDLCELEYICDSGILSMVHDHEIKLMFGGTRDPKSDSNKSARDIQYQIYFAARLLLSSYKIVWEEPDFSMCFSGEKIRIAVKRVSSANKIYDRILEAEKQILQFSDPGIVVISLDLIEPYIQEVFVNSDDLYSIPSYKLMKILKKNMKDIRLYNRNPQIKAIIVTYGIAQYNTEKAIFGYGISLKVLPLGEGIEFEQYKVIGTNLFI